MDPLIAKLQATPPEAVVPPVNITERNPLVALGASNPPPAAGGPFIYSAPQQSDGPYRPPISFNSKAELDAYEQSLRPKPKSVVDQLKDYLGAMIEGGAAVGGMTGGPAGAVVGSILAAPNRVAALGYGAGKSLSSLREVPASIETALDDLLAGFKGGNVTKADQTAAAAARKQELAEVDRQLGDVTRRQQQRAQGRMDWVSDYIRGQPLPQGLAKHEYDAILQDFDRLGFQNRDAPSGRWMTRDATRAEIEAARDAAPKERRSLAPRERYEPQSVLGKLMQDPAQPPATSRPSLGAVATGAGATGALGIAAYLQAVKSGLLPRPAWMTPQAPEGNGNLEDGK